jgi:hypothetical protein
VTNICSFYQSGNWQLHTFFIVGPYIAARAYLRSVLTIDAGFLSGQYVGKLFMACGYDAEQQLLSLVFAVVVGEKSVAN